MGRRLTEGGRVIRWIEKHCKIPEGKYVGQPVKLTPWQKKFIREVYDTPTRTAIMSFARKNAKTALAAFLCLVHLCGPRSVPNSQLYSAAQSRDQAALLFDLMCKVIRQSPMMLDALTIKDSAKEVHCYERGTVYKACSADAGTQLGRSPIFVVHDELGQVRGPRSPLYEALETASMAHDNPLSIIISTQAPEDADLLSVIIDDALAGHDPKIKVSLYTADTAIDPFSVKAMKQANPAWNYFMNVEEVKNYAAKARRMPSMEAGYRNLHLNQRIARETAFVGKLIWDVNNAPPREEDFRRRAVIGLDLSKRLDLTAMVVAGEGADGGISVESHFFAPAIGVEDRSISDRVPYDLWAERKFLTLCPGKEVSYSYVAERLVDVCSRYNVVAIYYDRWRISELELHLERLDSDDLPLEPHGQGFKDMSPALDALESELVAGRLRHGANPVLTWNATNAVVDEDPAGNRKLNKKKATGRIDGMVAMAMAVGGLLRQPEEMELEIDFA